VDSYVRSFGQVSLNRAMEFGRNLTEIYISYRILLHIHSTALSYLYDSRPLVHSHQLEIIIHHISQILNPFSLTPSTILLSDHHLPNNQLIPTTVPAKCNLPSLDVVKSCSTTCILSIHRGFIGRRIDGMPALAVYVSDFETHLGIETFFSECLLLGAVSCLLD